MRRLVMIILPLLFLAGCTGTQEPPLKILLAVGEGQKVVFYPAGTGEAGPLGSWDIGVTVVDLARLVGEKRLWVLTASHLRAYPLQGSREDHAPDAAAPALELELGGECAAGKLVTGEQALLVNCGDLGLWTVHASVPALKPVDREGDPDGTVYVLGPDDRVVRLQPGMQDFTLVYPNPPDDPIRHEVTLPEDLEALSADWNGELLGIAAGFSSSTSLYLWEAGSKDEPSEHGSEPDLSGLRWIQALPDGWLIVGKDAYVLRLNKNMQDPRSGSFVDAAVTPDAFVYLVGPGRMVAIDLLDPDLTEHGRSVGADARTVALFPTSD